jgi:hypothetical protein
MQSAVVDARIIRPESERGIESAKRAAYVRNHSRERGLRYTKSSFSTLQADFQQTRASEVARDIQRWLGSFKLRITALVRRECQVASDEELGLKEPLKRQPSRAGRKGPIKVTPTQSSLIIVPDFNVHLSPVAKNLELQTTWNLLKTSERSLGASEFL